MGLAGGGIYGFCHVGALMELEKYPDLMDIKSIRGVSVGSIIAALYSVNYTATEIRDIIMGLNFENLIQDSRFIYFRLYEYFGMHTATKLEEKLEELISRKTNIKNCTFSQINKNLTIIATNLNYQRPAYFNRYYTPYMPISHAVRLSISYPILITPVIYNGDLYGDGGEFINYPITTFRELDKTMGLTFAAHNENHDGTLKKRIEINDLYSYIKAVATTFNRATYVSQLNQKYLSRSIVIDIETEIDSMNLNPTQSQKEYMINCGILAVKRQINKFM